MKYIKMSYRQIEEMVAKDEGYDSLDEWRKDSFDEYQSIYDLVPVADMGFSKYYGAKYYIFERTDGKMGIWYKY